MLGPQSTRLGSELIKYAVDKFVTIGGAIFLTQFDRFRNHDFERNIDPHR